MDKTETLKETTLRLKETAKNVYSFIDAATDKLSFVECDRFTGGDLSSVVCGFAEAGGNPVAIFAINSAVFKGGVGHDMSVKIEKLIDNAVKTGLPVIGVIDSAGAQITEGIGALESYGRIFKALSSAYGSVPVIIVNKGDNFGLSSYFCGMCDVCIAYEKSLLSTTSPLILAAKANKDLSAVANTKIHTQDSGIISLVIKNDAELKKAVSGILDILGERFKDLGDDPNRVSKKLKAFLPPSDYIEEIFDKNSFIELRAGFATEVITGLARLGGASVLVIANNSKADGGKLTSNAAIKITEALYTASSYNIPVINLVDCVGATTDLNEENGSLIREIAALIGTYSAVNSAKISLITGNAFGAGYSVFASKGYMDYSLAYEDSLISVAGIDSAVSLIYFDEIAKEKDKAKALKKYAKIYGEQNCSALVAAKSGILDNIIEPQFSRQYLIAALKTFINK